MSKRLFHSSILSLVLISFLALPWSGCNPVSEPNATPERVGLDFASPKSSPVQLEPDADIFATVWNLPESHVSVTRLGSNGIPLNPDAQMIVNEQGKAGDCLDDDRAPQPLLTGVDDSLFQEPTFRTLIALLDNFTAAELKPETGFDKPNHPHWAAVEEFLDAVFETKPMQVAVAHIQKQLAPGTSLEQIRSDVKQMWFEPFTNHYRSAQPFCVGFEHVFVGEDESEPGHAPKCLDRVGGYHSWVKFYRDQKAGKADYLGYDYPDGNVTDALTDPHIATIVMRWSPTQSEDGSHGNDLLKKPGGFFVGTRPELEIAFGTLAMYAQQANQFDNVAGKVHHHRVRLGENLFDLVMHPQSLPPSEPGGPTKPGNHIRTMYPKFRGRAIPEKRTTRQHGDVPTQPHNNAQIQIVRAMVNPKGQDDTGEWIEIKNVTDDTTFELSEWRLQDQSGRSKKLSGQLPPGKLLRVLLKRTDQASLMLKNGEGWILLFQDDVRRAAVSYAAPKSGIASEFSK